MEVGARLHLQDLKDAVTQAMAGGKAPGSNRVTTTLITELLEHVDGLLVDMLVDNLATFFAVFCAQLGARV